MNDMERKFMTIDNCKLSYLVNNPNVTEMIFFIHSNSSSANIWQKQFADRELSNYRLIAFDLPAHGQSDALSENKYSLPNLATLFAEAVVQLFNGGKYILSGLSFGTNIIAEMIADRRIQPKGIILISPVIVGSDITFQHTSKTGVDPTPLFIDNANDVAIKNCIRASSLSADEKDYDGY